MSSRVTRSQTKNVKLTIPSPQKEDHNESELTERESELSRSIAKFYTKKTQLDARETDLAKREAELAEREKKLARALYLEDLRNKKKLGIKLTDLELFEEGSTPHHHLSLYRTHRFVCKNTCSQCRGRGWCQGERGPAGYGNEEWRCPDGRWEPKTEEEILASSKWFS
jgi:hypothetical protein